MFSCVKLLPSNDDSLAVAEMLRPQYGSMSHAALTMTAGTGNALKVNGLSSVQTFGLRCFLQNVPAVCRASISAYKVCPV